jgi:hypothetical protein
LDRRRLACKRAGRRRSERAAGRRHRRAGPGNPPRYVPVRYGDYLMDRLNRNYDYRKDAAAE